MWALVKEFKLPRTARLTIAVLLDYLSSRAHNKLARHTTIKSQCASITHGYSSLIIILTPSLPWYHLKTTRKNVKFDNSFFVFFFVLACERIFIKADSTESRCVIGPETSGKYTGVVVGFFWGGHSWIFQPRNFTGWGSKWVNNECSSVPSYEHTGHTVT